MTRLRRVGGCACSIRPPRESGSLVSLDSPTVIRVHDGILNPNDINVFHRRELRTRVALLTIGHPLPINHRVLWTLEVRRGLRLLRESSIKSQCLECSQPCHQCILF